MKVAYYLSPQFIHRWAVLRKYLHGKKGLVLLLFIALSSFSNVTAQTGTSGQITGSVVDQNGGGGSRCHHHSYPG
jgi:hypothetical protein